MLGRVFVKEREVKRERERERERGVLYLPVVVGLDEGSGSRTDWYLCLPVLPECLVLAG